MRRVHEISIGVFGNVVGVFVYNRKNPEGSLPFEGFVFKETLVFKLVCSQLLITQLCILRIGNLSV